ncbi:MAG: EamA family transporter [Candidatus Nomurabacteria bacterium]|nr:EamA family transporter [Candidatus Nomurabacteria bacterium]
MFWLIPISALIVCEVIADIFAKEYSLKGHWYLWLFAILGYIVGNAFFLWGMRSGSGLARAGIIFSVGSAIGVVVLGVLVYGESTNKVQIAGLILGALSLILIFWE